jgi:hypothetical protein
MEADTPAVTLLLAFMNLAALAVYEHERDADLELRL